MAASRACLRILLISFSLAEVFQDSPPLDGGPLLNSRAPKGPYGRAPKGPYGRAPKGPIIAFSGPFRGLD
jgi:hypothetical protein